MGEAEAPADLDVAWGMVDVNLVASLTLRGPILDAIVEALAGTELMSSSERDGGV